MLNPFNLLQTIGIGAAAVLLAFGVEEYRLHLWRVDYDELSGKYETCKTNYTTAHNNELACEAGITSRNSQIEADAAKGEADAANASKDADKALAGAKERKAIADSQASGPDAMNKFTHEVIK